MPGSTCSVLDKAVFPRDKVCAGWITPAVLDEIDLDPAEYRRGRVLQPITAFRVGRQDGPMIDLDYDAAVSYGIRRCEFDRYLLERSGARLQLGEPLESIVREPDGWIVNDRYRTPMLVGAGGHFCPVARWLGDSGPAERHARRPPRKSSLPVVAAQEIEFALDESPGGRVPGGKPAAGTLFLHGSDGLRLVFPQGKLPQYRPGARRPAPLFGARGRLLRSLERARADPATCPASSTAMRTCCTTIPPASCWPTACS